MRLKTFSYCGTTFFMGDSNSEPLKHCITKAKELEHSFIVASDYLTKKKVTKIFGSYRDARDFWRCTKNQEQKAFYVVVPENQPCCLYADIEWPLDWKEEAEVKNKFEKIISKVLEQVEYKFDGDFYFSTASDEEKNKGSLHAHIPSVVFKNVKEQQIFFNKVYGELTEDNEWTFVDETEKSYILKTMIDFGVYNKNRQMRLPYSCKIKDEKYIRPFIPYDEVDFDIENFSIVDLRDFEEGHFVNVSSLPVEIKCNKSNWYNKELLQKICDDQKLEVTIETLKGSLITLKNKLTRECPIGGEENKGDNAYLTIKGDTVFYQCHDLGCSKKKLKIYKKEDDDLQDEIPFSFWCRLGNQIEEGEDEKYSQWKKNMVKCFNKYMVKIRDPLTPYLLARNVTYNEEGEKEVSYRAIKYEKAELVFREYKTNTLGKARPKCIITEWLDDENSMIYDKEDCLPLDENKKVPYNTFNTFRGLAITRAIALEKGNDDPSHLLDFIKKAWCNEDENLYTWVISWMAHLIQRPWRKMQTAIVIRGNEGTGKGMIIQLLKKIIGASYSVQPTSAEQIFGNFNSILDNKLFVFLDEMFWGGNVKNASQLKALLTEKTRTSNAKFAPARTTTNMMNFILASNEDWVIPAGTNARRYTVLNISNHFYTLSKPEKKALYDFCPYSFAKYLYSVPLDDFECDTCYNTQALIDQKLMNMQPIDQFIMELIEHHEHLLGTEIESSDLYDIYSRTAVGNFRMKLKAFSRALTDPQKYGIVKERKRNETGIRKYYYSLPSTEILEQKVNDRFNGVIF